MKNLFLLAIFFSASVSAQTVVLSQSGNPVAVVGTSDSAAMKATQNAAIQKNIDSIAAHNIRIESKASMILPRFIGTTNSDAGPAINELLSSSTWSYDASWSGSFATGFVHTAGTTTALTASFVPTIGTTYVLNWSYPAWVAGYANFTMAGASGTMLVGVTNPVNLTYNSQQVFTATTVDPLVVTPLSTFNGTITLSVRVISSPTVNIFSSNNSPSIQIRASSAFGNSIIGLNAGASLTTATYNTLFGMNAGVNLTTNGSNSFFGYNAGSSTTGTANTYIGAQAAHYSVSGSYNTSTGAYAGYYNTTGGYNSNYGAYSGMNTTTGINNSYMGYYAGAYNSIGSGNTAVGYLAGARFGLNAQAGNNNTSGSNSIFLGEYSTAGADGQTNQIVIGYNSTGLGSNTTVIGNSAITDAAIYGRLSLGTTTPVSSALLNLSSTTKGLLLPRMTTAQMNSISSPIPGLLVFLTDSLSTFQYIGGSWQNLKGVGGSGGGGTGLSGWSLYGNPGTNSTSNFIGTTDNVGLSFRTNNTEKMFIGTSGSVGIGTSLISDTAYKLFVETGIKTRKVKVDAIAWADYVFDKDYKLSTLAELEKFIARNKHLPNVPSEKEVLTNGIDVAETQKLLLQKVEELTLYIIEQDKQSKQQKEKIKLQNKETANLQSQLTLMQQQLDEIKAALKQRQSRALVKYKK